MIVVQGIVGGGKIVSPVTVIIMGQMNHDAPKTGNSMVILKTVRSTVLSRRGAGTQHSTYGAGAGAAAADERCLAQGGGGRFIKSDHF